MNLAPVSDYSAARSYLANLHTDASRQGATTQLRIALQTLDPSRDWQRDDVFRVPWEFVTLLDLRLMIRDLADNGASPNTVRACVRAVRGALHASIRDGRGAREATIAALAQFEGLKIDTGRPRRRFIAPRRHIARIAGEQNERRVRLSGPTVVRNNAIAVLLLAGASPAELVRLQRHHVQGDSVTLPPKPGHVDARFLLLSDLMTGALRAWEFCRGDAPGPYFFAVGERTGVIVKRGLRPIELRAIVHAWTHSTTT